MKAKLLASSDKETKKNDDDNDGDE